MTQHDVSAAGRPPGRRWYLIAVLIAIAGWVAMAFFLVSRLGDSTERMIRVLAPGQVDVVLKEPGSYTIFHEYRSTFEGRVYSVSSVSGLHVAVRRQTAGEELPLTMTAGSRYSVGDRAGHSLFRFEVREPGTYQIAATYDGGRKEPQIVLAIDRGFIGELVTTILLAVAMAFAGMGTAIAIAVVVFIRRRRAKLAAVRA